jgi:hypothetical protein
MKAAELVSWIIRPCVSFKKKRETATSNFFGTREKN